MNDIKLLGRLAHAPELKKSGKGRSYVWFTVAVPRKNNREEADFVRCVAFDKLADAVNAYCNKGRQVLVQGRLQVSQKIDEATKKPKYYHTVVAHATHFLHDPHNKNTNSKEEELTPEDVPF